MPDETAGAPTCFCGRALDVTGFLCDDIFAGHTEKDGDYQIISARVSLVCPEKHVGICAPIRIQVGDQDADISLRDLLKGAL